MTTLSPDNNWGFLYPVCQVNNNKDYIALIYLICGNKRDIFETLDRAIIIGYLSPNEIEDSQFYPEGTYTPHGTYSNIDNYLTLLTDWHAF